MEFLVLVALILAILALRNASKLRSGLQAIREELKELRIRAIFTARTAEHGGITGDTEVSEATPTTETASEDQVETEPPERLGSEGHWGPVTREPLSVRPPPAASVFEGEQAVVSDVVDRI
jgi:hypothetical protein